MKQNVQDAINDQIQAEIQSAYLYLSMSASFEEQNLSGFAHWLKIQWEEELEHAMKFYNFILERGGSVQLKALDAPEHEFGTPLQAFEKVLEHEKYVTSRINNLYELAIKENDYPLQVLLHWFIEEQVEEEDNASTIVEKLKMIGDSGASLFMLDRVLGEREDD